MISNSLLQHPTSAAVVTVIAHRYGNQQGVGVAVNALGRENVFLQTKVKQRCDRGDEICLKGLVLIAHCPISHCFLPTYVAHPVSDI